MILAPQHIASTIVSWAALDAAPPRPNHLRRDDLALAILVYLLSATVIAGLVRLTTGEAQGVLGTVLVGGGAQVIGIGVCLLIAARQFEGGIRSLCFSERGARLRPWFVLSAAFTIVAALLCPIILDSATSVVLYFAPDHEFAPHPTIKALQDRAEPTGMIILLWAGAVVIAPIAEELFFRGLLQTLLVRLVRSRWLAICLASLSFGAVHFQQPHAIPALVVLALLLGYAYERTGSVLPPILIHALFNLKTLIWDTLVGLCPLVGLPPLTLTPA